MPDKLLSADPKAGMLLSADPTVGIKPAENDEHPFLHTIATVTGVGMPVMRNLLEHLATNPNVAKTAATIGRAVGGLAPPIAGAVEGGPIGLLAGIAAASKGAWAGGKTGWFTGKMLQGMAAPLARAATAVEPYMPAIAMLAQEGDTLERLNTPDAVGALAKTLKPEQRYKLLAHYRTQPEYVSAITKAIR